MNKSKSPELNKLNGSIRSLVHRGFPNYPSNPIKFLEWYMRKKPKNKDLVLANIVFCADVAYKAIRYEEKVHSVLES